MKRRALGALALIATLGAAPCGAQTVDYGRSRISCVSVQMKVPVEAVFRKFSAQIAFDPVKPEAGKAQIEIDLASFDIGNEEVNEDVKGRAWFDVKTHPTARFVASAVRPLGGGRYEARGPLTIKGRTHETAAVFTMRNDAAGNAVFEGGFPIRRLQFNIGEGVWKDTETVADEVQIKFRIQMSGKTPPTRP